MAELEPGNCFIDGKPDPEALEPAGDDEIKVADGIGVEISSKELHKLDVVPVCEASVGSSCGSQRSMLRLCIEMNIKPKMTGGRGEVDENNQISDEPVKVIVDYPDDVVVTVNAKIQRFDRDISSPSCDEVDEIPKKWQNANDKVAITDHNENKLDTTFLKVPLSSTLIYPIIEEAETSDDVHNDVDTVRDATVPLLKESLRKSGSGDASLYHTVMDDNDGAVGFGDISAIEKSEKESIGKASQDQTSAKTATFGKNPSLKLNSNLMLFKSEKITPGEKLLKALHILARYRGVWGIYEDETIIVKHLMNLNMLLTTTDTTTVYNTCRDEDYLEVRGLISYFSLEKRFVIRSELLQTFTLLSQKSHVISSFIAASDIPIVLASEVQNGDYTSREVYAYSSYLLQMISTAQLSETQQEDIGEELIGSLCTMIVKADKKHYRTLSEILFETLLHYYEQLGETDLKWHSLHLAGNNQIAMKKIKQKLKNILMRNASLSPRSEERSQNECDEGKLKKILYLLKDLIVCDCTKDLFTDAELDIILVTLIHNLENAHFIEFQREALEAIYRILKVIKAEPSGLDKLERLVMSLLKQGEGSGDHDRSYRSVLKKIYKIVK